MLISDFVNLIHHAQRQCGAGATIRCGASDIAGVAIHNTAKGKVVMILTRPTSGVFIPIPPPAPDPIEPTDGA